MDKTLERRAMMKSQKPAVRRKKRKPQAGLTLLEVVIALAILLIISVNIMTVALLAITTTESKGHLTARTAEYAQDKMEQLLALAFNDTTSDTTAVTSGIITTSSTGGTGLAVGGSSNPLAPVAGYVDYLDANGNPVAATGQWYYIRVWQVALVAGAPTTVVNSVTVNTAKIITVTVRVNSSVGGVAMLPQSTLTTGKSYPF